MAELLSAVTDAAPDVVCISALPSFAIDHARVLYQKLRSKMPEVDIVICLWHYEGDMEKTVRRLKVSDAQAVQTTLAEVLEHIEAKAKPTSIEVSRTARTQALDVSSERQEEPA
jgi:predicted amidophosphoribosyltransferase